MNLYVSLKNCDKKMGHIFINYVDFVDTQGKTTNPTAQKTEDVKWHTQKSKFLKSW